MARILDRIKTERLLLRGINETDALEIVEWRSDPEVFMYFKSPHRISVQEHFQWYNNNYLLNENRLDWMCIEKTTGRKIGVFGLANDKGMVELNYLLAPDARHKGYACESINALIQYARKKWDSKPIIAEIHKDNVPSVALVKRLGFEHKSDKGDFVIYEIRG